MNNRVQCNINRDIQDCFTKGKTYDVIEETLRHYYIINDYNKKQWVNKSFFNELECEYDEIRL